eukprot:SAG31_NODE_2198_length_6212_cov_3.843096_3_plen_76_part_00
MFSLGWPENHLDMCPLIDIELSLQTTVKFIDMELKGQRTASKEAECIIIITPPPPRTQPHVFAPATSLAMRRQLS